MKRLLAATTALALVGGGGTGSFAEITISGDAKLGLDYNSEPGDMMSKHSFKHEMGVDFTGSGTTDGGLTFGAKAGFDTGADKTNTGTVFVSGSFGKVTVGDNDAADLLAGGIADVGLNGVGVDDVVEDIRGTTAKQFRYDQSVGSISLAISAGTSKGVEGKPNTWDLTAVPQVLTEGNFETKKNSYAIGMSFSASGATIGLGYDSKKTISAGLGYSTGQISANAFYAKGSREYAHLGHSRQPGTSTSSNLLIRQLTADGTNEAGMTGLGVEVSYTMGASTLTLAYAKTDLDNMQPYWDEDGTDPATVNSGSLKGLGVGFSHDLGGGAKLVAGFAKVPMKALGDLKFVDYGQVTAEENWTDLGADKNVASAGLSFSF